MSENAKMTKPSDDEIVRLWTTITSRAGQGGLALRIAGVDADRLEARGVTEADIDRLFGPELNAEPSVEWRKTGETGTNAAASPTKSREPCVKCKGNGRLRVADRVVVCDRCQGWFWEPVVPSPRVHSVGIAAALRAFNNVKSGYLMRRSLAVAIEAYLSAQSTPSDEA